MTQNMPEYHVDSQALIETTIEPIWPLVRTIRENVGETLSSFPSEFRFAAMVTASELMENAIKYGESVPHAPSIHFSMTTANGRLRVQTINASTNELGLKELGTRIEEIRRAPDKAALYLARLERLLECATESGKLGLYRIAFEGKFDLSYQYSNQTVTVTATRELP